jgi:prepilin-type N-terminal cleavage/methylation domain-containing protein
MNGHPVSRPSSRRAFTLIELLVVIGIIIFLFGLVYAFLPAVYQRTEATTGAQMVQNALAQARQRARRDGLACGIRFEPDRSIPGPARFVTVLKWIQQPADITGGPNATLRAPVPNSNLVIIQGADLTGIQQDLSNGQIFGSGDDYLEINGNGVPHRILGVDPGGGGVRLASNLPYTIPQTSEFRITRQPQPLQGERDIKLPKKVAIDLILCAASDPPKPAMFRFVGPAPPATSGGGLDIIFSPNGNVIGQWTDIDKVILFVRDYTDQDVKTGGSPALVGVQTRTGFIAAHPVDPIDAYSRFNTPRDSGL